MIRDVAIHLLNRVVMDERGWGRFSDHANLLSDEVPLIPLEGGVYILMSERTMFSYPAGGTSVFYIGMATSNLRSRLLDHRKFSHQVKNGVAESRYYQRYEWAANHGAMVTFSVRPRRNSALTPKALESQLLRAFGDAFRAPPLANSQSAW